MRIQEHAGQMAHQEQRVQRERDEEQRRERCLRVSLVCRDVAHHAHGVALSAYLVGRSGAQWLPLAYGEDTPFVPTDACVKRLNRAVKQLTSALDVLRGELEEVFASGEEPEEVDAPTPNPSPAGGSGGPEAARQ